MNVGKLMKQAQEMQKKMAQVQEELKERIVEASAGGGVVNVKVNGAQEIVDIKIAKEVINADDKDMLEELVITAINEGIKKSRKMAESEIAKVTGGLNIPGMT
ncbi:MAG: nucleoid-associated protein, YbaB/EbfC family [Planctomycetes bacterium RBG_16_43_13]|nr:MAG: nucleoid-associated protein, YbaB/EbfC family [Planctomycetes bacterium RBG_16_43_13]